MARNSTGVIGREYHQIRVIAGFVVQRSSEINIQAGVVKQGMVVGVNILKHFVFFKMTWNTQIVHNRSWRNECMDISCLLLL